MPKIIQQPLSSKTYLFITIIGLIVSIGSIVVYIASAEDLLKYNLENQIFYLILLLFGISISAFIFGAMNSYASLTGKRFNTNFNLAGPIVGIVLVVLGGFLLPSTVENEISLTVRLYNYNNNSLKIGNVKLYLKNEIKEQPIDQNGQVMFFIPKNKLGDIKLEVSSEGYKNEVRNFKIIETNTLDITMGTPEYFKIFGKVTTADEVPIPNVEINIDNTEYYTQTITDGSFSLRVKGINIGDEILIITSHQKYRDKTTHRIISGINEELNIVLSPVQ
jgi:hypothetical protein